MTNPHPTDEPDMDQQLHAWAERQRVAAQGDAPAPIPIAQTLATYRRRPLAPILAAIIITLLIAAGVTAVALRAHHHSNTEHPTPVGTSPSPHPHQQIATKCLPTNGAGPADDYLGQTLRQATTYARNHHQYLVIAGVAAGVGRWPCLSGNLIVDTRGGTPVAVIVNKAISSGTGFGTPANAVIVAAEKVEPTSNPATSASPHPHPAHLPGYVAVANSQHQEGQAKKTDVTDLQPRPTYPAQVLRWQRNRGTNFGGVVPMYAADGTTVIAQWHGLEPSDHRVALTCANNNGIGFALTPPPGEHGSATPLQAAQGLYANIGVTSFGTGTSPWTSHQQTDTTAALTAGPVTLHAEKQTNDTWIINQGQRCNP